MDETTPEVAPPAPEDDLPPETAATRDPDARAELEALDEDEESAPGPRPDADTDGFEEVEIPDLGSMRFRTTSDRDCERHHGRLVCDGPLRVAEPFGEGATLREELGLDNEARAGRTAMYSSPRPEWVAAIEGAEAEGLLWPVPGGRLWRGYGQTHELVRGRTGRLRHGSTERLHPGVDIGAPAGTPIRSVNDGLVVYSFNAMHGYGNSIVILHPDSSVTLYAHCQATYVFAGQRVRRGQAIGEVGHTGLAHGDHLHFEWRRNGSPRNPTRQWVDAPGVP